jgi:hypothetical protein
MSRKKSPVQRKPAPSEERARVLSSRDFLFINEVAELAGVGTELAILMVETCRIKPYVLEGKDGNPVNSYMTFKIKKMLAARGRIIPYFNHELASQRQWIDIMESAAAKPLDADWYFPPVNPDPLIRLDEDRAAEILTSVQEALALEGDAAEILRLVADSINILSRNDVTIESNSKWKKFGTSAFRGGK